MIRLPANKVLMSATDPVRDRVWADALAGPAGRACGPAAGPDASWVDEFIGNVRPFIFVREEDSLLIRMPNQAHRLNPQGVRVLKYLLDGGTAAGLLRGLPGQQQREDVLRFIWEIKRCLDGTLSESNRSGAVEVRPLALGFSRLPVLSEVALTARCNLRCAFCYYGLGGGAQPLASGGGTDCPGVRPVPAGVENKARKGEMTTSEVVRVLRVIYEQARVPSVSFTGGEPSLRRDLPELVAAAIDIGLRANLITNGTLVTRGLAESLAAAGLSSAQVSLEGASPAVHDAITGVAGSHERSLAGVAHLREAGISVHTNTTLNRLNLEEAVRIPRLITGELGLERFSMNLVIPSGSAGARHDILLRYAEVGEIVERVLTASQDCHAEFMWYSPTPACMFNPIPRGLGNKGCAACDGLLSVDCDGGVLPCSSWPEPVGNLLKESFDDVWSSRRAAALRGKSEAHSRCHRCESFAACQGACPLYWRHFGFGELEARPKERRVLA